MIIPNSQKVYTCPTLYKDTFVFEGKRYYLLSDIALVSDYGKYGFLPPHGRGFYLKISKKEFHAKKLSAMNAHQNYLKALDSGYLKSGGTQTTFDF